MTNVDWGHGRKGGAREVASILAADPHFRDRGACLDAEVVRGELAAAFPELGTRGPLEPVGVWYVPRKSLQVVYRAAGAGCANDTLLRLDVLGPGRAHPASALPGAGEHARVRLLPRLGAVGWLFPEDAELPRLAAVVDDRYLAEQLGPGGRWRSLSYLPGRRCALHHRTPGDPAGVVLRVQPPPDAAESFARLRAAWTAGSRRFRMPEPIGHDRDRGAFWERFVPGERLDALLGTDRFGPAIEEVVQELARFHQLRLSGLPSQGTAEILKRTTKAVAQARSALPTLGPALDRFEQLLARGAARLDGGAAATLHGDLHTANLVVAGDGVVFIDLDRMSVGDPAYDLALLGTRLLLVGLHHHADVGEVAARVACLPDLYHRAGGRAIAAGTFAWHVAALLVGRQIKTVIRHLAPGGDRLAATLLAWARRTLERNELDPSNLRGDPEEVGDGHEAAHAA